MDGQALNRDATQEERSAVEQIVATKAYVDNPELLPWYTKEIQEPKPDVRDLFDNYSKVPSADVAVHIKHVRDEAFKILSPPYYHPYPCLGDWGFLNFSIGQGPAYQEVVQRIKDGQQFLDLGCCMGQDVRKLVHDGAPSENTSVSDLKQTFWDLDFDMFLDKSSLKTKFLEADIFDDNSQLKQLDGKIDIVNTASFFHLFDLEDQTKAAKRVIRRLKPVPNSLIVGRQGGKPEAGSFAHLMKGMNAFWHNAEPWKDMWKKVGRDTGTKWPVEAVLGEEDLSKRMKTNLFPAGTRFMTFTVRRI